MTLPNSAWTRESEVPGAAGGAVAGPSEQPSDFRRMTVQQAFELALQHHQAARLPEAEDLYNQVLQAEPDQPVALHMLGVIAHQMGKNDIAVDLITKALAVTPDHAGAHNNLGLALQDLGLLDEAAASHLKALAIEPEYAEAHYNLGNALRGLGELEDAAARYRTALAIKPDLADAHNNLGAALQDLGKLSEVIPCFRNALAIKPDYAEAHYNLGNAFQDLGNLDEAVNSYLKALAIEPGYAEAHKNLGNAFKELGKLDEAVACYHKSLEIKPDYADALFNLHATLYGSTDLEPAAHSLEEAARIAPEDRKVRFFLGMIRDYQGHAEQARKHFTVLRNGADENDARLDSWQYIKSSSADLPRLFGHTLEGLRLGIEAAQTDGLVMEFGVRFGTSIRHLSTMAGQDVHGFDSFQGLPEAWHNEPKGVYTTHGVLPEVPENVHLHVGLFEETLPSFLKEHTDPVRFMNVDCDLYGSTKTVLDLLGDRIVSGTVIVYDEYFGNSHWREDEFKAFQEAVEKFGWQYDYLAVSLLSKQAVVLIR